MSKISHITLFCCLLGVFLFGGCNATDDLTDIFLGKTWKLSFIAPEGDYVWYDFWDGDSDAQDASIEILTEDNTFTITFSGTLEGNVIEGTVRGNATNSYSGTWSANGKTNAFQASVSSNSSEQDVLAQKFVEGINNATSYAGDQNNLYLLYQEDGETLRMIFHVD